MAWNSGFLLVHGLTTSKQYVVYHYLNQIHNQRRFQDYINISLAYENIDIIMFTSGIQNKYISTQVRRCHLK